MINIKHVKTFKMILRIFMVFIFLSANAFSEEITFYADSMEGVAGNKDNVTILNGNAFIKTSTMEIHADTIELSGKDFRFITASGNISCVNSESELEFTCGKMKYDRESKIVELSEKVHLVDKKNNVSSDAEIVEYNQNTDVAVMQINIKLVQKDNVCTGVYSIYHKNEQTLEINGNAQVTQGKDTFSAQSIILDLKTQEITLNGNVKGSVTDSKKVEVKKDTGSNASDSKASDSTKSGDGTKTADSTKSAGDTKPADGTKPDEGTKPADGTKSADSTKSDDGTKTIDVTKSNENATGTDAINSANVPETKADVTNETTKKD